MVAAQLQNSVKLAAASKPLAAFCVNVEMLCEPQPAAEREPQVREIGVARGKHLHQADMEASPIAQLTDRRHADSSAGQRALGALAAAAEHTDGPTMTSYDACTAAGRALVP